MIKGIKPPGFFATYLRGHIRAFNEGFRMPWSAPLKSIMTIITLAVCFYIPLLLWTVWANYKELNQSWSQQASIAIFLSRSAEEPESKTFIEELEKLEWVLRVEVMTKDQIQQKLENDEQVSQVVDLVELHQLPDQILIYSNSKVDKQIVHDFVSEVTLSPNVSYVSFDEEWISQLSVVTSTLLQLARLSALIFLIIVIVFLVHIIGNEISLHKKELQLLELIGASGAQLRRRFLYLGGLFGFYSGFLAVILLFISLLWFEIPIQNLAKIYATEIEINFLSAIQIMIVLVVCVVITWVAARISLSAQNHALQ